MSQEELISVTRGWDRYLGTFIAAQIFKKWHNEYFYQFLFWCSELMDSVGHIKDTICKTNWARWIRSLIFKTPLQVLFISDSTLDERHINGVQSIQIERICLDITCNLQLWCFSGLSSHLGFPVPFDLPDLQILFWELINKDINFKHDFPIYHGFSSLSCPMNYKFQQQQKPEYSLFNSEPHASFCQAFKRPH